MIIGIVVALVFLLIAALSVTFYCIKKKRSSFDGPEKTNKTSQQTFPVSRSVPLISVLNGHLPIPSKDEFDRLTKFEDGLFQRATMAQGKRYNPNGELNRVTENLPFDHNRVKLRKPIKGCDYVNATTLSNYSHDPTRDEIIYSSYIPFKTIKFVIGQNPMDVTMQHHYRMILENRINTIVCFNEKDNQMSLQVGTTYSFGELSLKIHSKREITENLLGTEVTIIDTTARGAQNLHPAKYFEFLSYPEEGTSSFEDAERFVSCLCTIRNEMKRLYYSHKVFVHDSLI